MRNHSRNLLGTFFSAMMLCIAACGGGGGGTAAPAIGGIEGTGIQGIEGTGIAIGPVTGFGSVFVNGIEYFTTSAAIKIDGSSGSESQLKIGQIVTVKGSVNTGGRTANATEVNFVRSVQGPVAALDVAAGTFTVLGQLVRVNGTTIFDNSLSPATIDGLATAGLIVEVSGFRNAANDIVATRIERAAAGAELEVTGVVAALSTANSTFTVNGQTIDYSAAAVTNGTLANGVLVEAKGTTLTSGGALKARAVEIQSSVSTANNDGGKVQGVITRFGSSTDFDIGATKVTTNSSTVFTNNGLTIGLNIKAEVEGRFNASGVLVAAKVELKPDNAIRLHATIDSIDTATNTLKVLGGSVTVNSATQFEDKSNARVSPLKLSSLRVGDFVEVRGYENSGGTSLIAVIFERQNADNKIEVIATATNPADPNLTILGGTIALTGNQIRFDGATSSNITRAQFFAQVAGKLVRLRGTLNGSVITWDRAEIRN